MNYYNSIEKWSENVFREVKNEKKFLLRESWHPFPWTPSPTALALCALAHTTYTIDVPYFNLLYRALYGFNYNKSIKKWSENASSKMYKSKIFLSRERGYSFLWIPITCSHSPLQLGMYQENYWCFLIPTFIFPFVKSFIWLNYYKSIKKWSEIVSREVQKSENFPTQGKEKPNPLDPIPHSLGPSGLGKYHVHY